jgi:hypothetical protein
VSETVVDDLESVEVQEQDRKGAVVPSGTSQSSLETVEKESPVR